MKSFHYLSALAISTFMCVPAQAQDDMETRHEVAVSYGVKPNSTWFDVLTDIIPAMFGETHENYKCVGPIGLEYYYHTSPLIGVGAVAVFSTNQEDGFYEKIQNSHINRTYFTFMPSVKFNWLRKNHWGLYSKLAAGVTYAYFNEKYYDKLGKNIDDKATANDIVFNFQATAIGVEAGSSHVRAFTELGIGEQGIALAGVRFKF